MKTLARSYVWWPSIDKEIEATAKDCRACQSVKSAPPRAPLHPWVLPAKPWQRLHIDLARPTRQWLDLMRPESETTTGDPSYAPYKYRRLCHGQELQRRATVDAWIGGRL